MNKNPIRETAKVKQNLWWGMIVLKGLILSCAGCTHMGFSRDERMRSVTWRFVCGPILLGVKTIQLEDDMQKMVFHFFYHSLHAHSHYSIIYDVCSTIISNKTQISRLFFCIPTLCCFLLNAVCLLYSYGFWMKSGKSATRSLQFGSELGTEEPLLVPKTSQKNSTAKSANLKQSNMRTRACKIRLILGFCGWRDFV